MPTNTLTSLAMLKVNIDQGRDYLDYIRPFIFHVLMEHSPDPITDQIVSEYIRQQFGLQIPARTVQIVLKRISRQYPLKRDLGVYRITGELPDPQLAAKQSEAERHIIAVCEGLRQFSQDTIRPISSQEDAVSSMLAFLSEFDISCLRAYLRGTAIPSLEETHQADIILVSDYVQEIRRTNPERFNSFLILVQGHMLANALMCPDLHSAPKNYGNTTFYLDTPLLIRRLGSEGEAKEAAVRELIALVRRLGGKFATFAHSRDELKRVLQGAANYLEAPDARGAVIFEARKRGLTRSDLLLLAESIDDKLDEAGIEVKATPLYIEEFQIDETAFEQVLEDGVSYYNPRAKEYDINSVRSIYVIRGNVPTPSVEKARAVFVTSNTAFAKAAWEYGQQHDSSKDVSSVITDFSLANTAWLKSPMGAPTIPITQLLAFSYAALEPSAALLGKYLNEIDKLEAQGNVTERDHQLLRSSPLVYRELMHLTLGEDASLTAETVTDTLERVSAEIKKEESTRLAEEKGYHQDTQEALDFERTRTQEIISKLYWRCLGRARTLALALSVGAGVLLAIVLLLLSEMGLFSASPVISWVFIGVSTTLALLTLANLVFGSTVKGLHERLQSWTLTRLLMRESKATGVDLSEFME